MNFFLLYSALAINAIDHVVLEKNLFKRKSWAVDLYAESVIKNIV